MNEYKWIDQFIEKTKDKWTNISDYVWANPETRFEEFKSSSFLIEALEKEGFTVKKNAANIETAFIGEFGSGKPVIGFLGEYDALAGLSQKEGISFEEPIIKNGNGHGCGHNLLGTGALAAATALKEYVTAHDIPCTIRFYGCPGEEGGSGKTFMAREGVFDDVDVALTWHPGAISYAMGASSLANIQVYFQFKGKTSHAAASPHLGRSALDAVELMNIGVNYLREHIIDQARVHYAITNSGGISPNVVQGYAEVLYLVRAPHMTQVQEIFERVKKIAHGACLMTETEVEIVIDKACSNYIPNDVISEVMSDTIAEFGLPSYTEKELQFAGNIQSTLSTEDMRTAFRELTGSSISRNKPLADGVKPYIKGVGILPGSTDVGDVSWITPTAQCHFTTCAIGTPFHTWQVVAQGKTSYAHKGMLQVAKVLSMTALKLLQKPELIAEAKAELAQTIGEDGYICPIPADVYPSAIGK
ncbi:M20 family metallopeptidase [Bacillus sp. 03113]|uniref:M20 family metallopeptidase n=1 Tax=Bacillus sp. 03113 TaxID=2578211 RepID=UPI0011437F80|nr:M20 family metallopeptidase [Bacillus sp. 03113]